MRPVVKRILIQGGLTAAILALVGLALAEMAAIWSAGNAGRPASADLNPPPPDSLRYRIPLTLAAAGFVFVAVGEWVMARIRARKEATKPPEPRPDEAEKLLNELLAQAEAKMSAEAGKSEPERTISKEESPDADKKPGA